MAPHLWWVTTAACLWVSTSVVEEILDPGLCAMAGASRALAQSREGTCHDAFIQLDAGQSGCGATYRLTLGLSVPWLASMVALLHRLI